jgi:ribosomal protein S18 acetylase RimI-like enzyme
MLKLVPMDPSIFDAYLERSTADYAEEHIRSGNWQREGALEKARAEFKHLLPDGLQTKDQYLYSITEPDTGRKLGMIWFKVTEDGTRRRAFFYEFYIDESYRGKGFGKQALAALDETLASLGVDFIDLHVFASNTTAIELYKKMGYEVTNMYMRKLIKK